jgi:uncharacterized protein (DUF1015 family)
MPTLDPVAHALVPVDSAAADALGAPNYDEFQSDLEVWELLRAHPLSVLRVTMPHCDVADPDAIREDGSEASLAVAEANMARLAADPRVHRIRDILWVYEITRSEAPERPQIGLGGMARTDEIATPENPEGVVIRNEGIREEKARGRARLTKATRCDMGTVNLAVDDATGGFQSALEEHARGARPNLETVDEGRNRHRVWLVQGREAIARWQAMVVREPLAYVADGNHRSAAAAILGNSHYLSVVFPANTMTIAPYNRLVESTEAEVDDVMFALQKCFTVDRYRSEGAYQPTVTHEIGLYDGSAWWRLRPREGAFDPEDAAQDIDADIVQRLLFSGVFGLHDARDDRITYVGANRDAEWLQQQVDTGRMKYAVTLPPVTMEQFINVCLQHKLMPPKSTWFVPKIRSGLVMAMLEERSGVRGPRSESSPH